MNIIQYLLSIIQYLYQQNCWLINFICRYIPLKQWAFDDSHSPKYQKFTVDELPESKSINMNGTGSSSFLTLSSATAKRSNPFPGVNPATSLMTAAALPARPPSLTSIATMGRPGRSSARYATPTSHLKKTAFPGSSLCAVPIAGRLLPQRKSANTLSCTNA